MSLSVPMAPRSSKSSGLGLLDREVRHRLNTSAGRMSRKVEFSEQHSRRPDALLNQADGSVLFHRCGLLGP